MYRTRDKFLSTRSMKNQKWKRCIAKTVHATISRALLLEKKTRMNHRTLPTANTVTIRK